MRVRLREDGGSGKKIDASSSFNCLVKKGGWGSREKETALLALSSHCSGALAAGQRHRQSSHAPPRSREPFLFKAERERDKGEENDEESKKLRKRI